MIRRRKLSRLKNLWLGLIVCHIVVWNSYIHEATQHIANWPVESCTMVCHKIWRLSQIGKSQCKSQCHEIWPDSGLFSQFHDLVDARIFCPEIACIVRWSHFLWFSSGYNSDLFKLSIICSWRSFLTPLCNLDSGQYPFGSVRNVSGAIHSMNFIQLSVSVMVSCSAKRESVEHISNNTGNNEMGSNEIVREVHNFWTQSVTTDSRRTSACRL